MKEYDQSAPKVGATGLTHKSAAEAKASFKLYPYGWVPCETRFPQKFYDSEGTEYQACPDFFHPASGFYAEFKAHKMNGKGTKQRADKAMAQVDADIAMGYVAATKRPYRELLHAWHHSIQTMACKTAQLPSSMPLVLIYETLQDQKEEARCARNGVFMLSLDNLKCFNSFFFFASIGVDATFSKNDRQYGIAPATI